MSEQQLPQIYLVTPLNFELDALLADLRVILTDHDIACLRLSMASQDEGDISRAADGLRHLCHEFDVAMVIDSHIGVVEKLGLDGVHIPFAAKSIRDLRKDFGADPIIGAHCGTSRHDGLTAAESGADYVVFGPVTADALGDGTTADPDLFQWWSEMIEVPVIAEGGLTPDAIALLKDKVDFFAFGPEIWSSDDPPKALAGLIAALG